MPDALGGSQGAPDLESIDYLGTKVPTSFKSQPALPTGRPAATGSAAPSTIGGSGVAGGKRVFTRPESENLREMLQGVFDSGGGPGVDSGSPAAGVTPSPPGSIVGWDPQSFQAALNVPGAFAPGMAGKALSLGATATGLFGGKESSLGVVGPDGKVMGAFPGERSGITGIKAIDAALGFLGIPTGLLEGVYGVQGMTQQQVNEFAQTLSEAKEELGLPPEIVQALQFQASGAGAFALGAPGAGIGTGIGPGQPGSPGFGSTPGSWGPAQTPPGYGTPPSFQGRTGIGVDDPNDPSGQAAAAAAQAQAEAAAAAAVADATAGTGVSGPTGSEGTGTGTGGGPSGATGDGPY